MSSPNVAITLGIVKIAKKSQKWIKNSIMWHSFLLNTNPDINSSGVFCRLLITIADSLDLGSSLILVQIVCNIGYLRTYAEEMAEDNVMTGGEKCYGLTYKSKCKVR